jgi:aldose 1-epimerase
LNVYTNQPAVHIYVGGNCFNQIKGKENTNYHPLTEFVLKRKLPSRKSLIIFQAQFSKEGETYYQKAIFEFIKI